MKPHCVFFLVLVIALLLTGCDREVRMDGTLWYGQGESIIRFDLAAQTLDPVQTAGGCLEVAADPLAHTFCFVCKDQDQFGLRRFSILNDQVVSTRVSMSEPISDPFFSPDAERSLFRIRRSGDVFDVYLHFHDAGPIKLAGRVGAACFGQNNDSIYLAQGDKVASHVIQDITRPEKMPAGGLRTLVSPGGVVRDMDYHLGIRRLVMCAGTKVVTCDFTGKDLRVVYDATRSPLKGQLRMPYRVRWSHDGTRVAALISTNGNAGAFLILSADGKRHSLIQGPAPSVGGFAWTKTQPLALN